MNTLNIFFVCGVMFIFIIGGKPGGKKKAFCRKLQQPQYI